MKPHPEIPDLFAMHLAIQRDLPVPLPWYAVWYSRSKFFDLRDEGKVEPEDLNGQLCLRPSEFAELVRRESVRRAKARRQSQKRKAPLALVFPLPTEGKTGSAEP